MAGANSSPPGSWTRHFMHYSCLFYIIKPSQDFPREGLHPCHPLCQPDWSSPAIKSHSGSWINGTEHLDQQLRKRGCPHPSSASPSEGLISPTVIFCGKIQFTPCVNDTIEREGALWSLCLPLSEQKIAKLTGI